MPLIHLFVTFTPRYHQLTLSILNYLTTIYCQLCTVPFLQRMSSYRTALRQEFDRILSGEGHLSTALSAVQHADRVS